MNHSNSKQNHVDTKRWLIGLCFFTAAATFVLWEEHKVHILGALPYLILLLCPVMHLFMHHGHGHSDHHDSADHREEHDAQH